MKVVDDLLSLACDVRWKGPRKPLDMCVLRSRKALDMSLDADMMAPRLDVDLLCDRLKTRADELAEKFVDVGVDDDGLLMDLTDPFVRLRDAGKPLRGSLDADARWARKHRRARKHVPDPHRSLHQAFHRVHACRWVPRVFGEVWGYETGSLKEKGDEIGTRGPGDPVGDWSRGVGVREDVTDDGYRTIVAWVSTLGTRPVRRDPTG